MQIYLHLPHEGKKLLCNEGDNVRKILLRHSVNPYRGARRLFNCHGNGLCGTCRVQVEPEGHVREHELTAAEKRHLAEAPGWRLACQLHAMRDLVVWTQPGKSAGASAPIVMPQESFEQARRAAAAKRGPREAPPAKPSPATPSSAPTAAPPAPPTTPTASE